MLNNIIDIVLKSVIGFVIPIIIGYLLGAIKNSKALKCLLRSNITSKYYVYKQLGYVPRYEKENVNYMYAQYKKMRGNSYIDIIMVEFNELPIKEG